MDTTAWIVSQENVGLYQRITLTPQNPGENGQNPILMEFYPTQGDLPKPAIFIAPILGGKNREASHFARYFSRRGYHCLVVHRPKDLTSDLRELKQLDDRFHQAVVRDRAALDWLCQQPIVKKEAIGSLGISYGGIKNVILAGVDDRLKANVFALAGADMASLATHSNHKVMKRLVETLHRMGKTTDAEVENEIRDTIRAEPLRFAPYIDPARTLLILARGDRTVPRSNGETLRKALGSPRTLYLPSGHYSTALFTGMFGVPYIECVMKEFFDTQLGGD